MRATCTQNLINPAPGQLPAPSALVAGRTTQRMNLTRASETCVCGLEELWGLLSPFSPNSPPLIASELRLVCVRRVSSCVSGIRQMEE